MLPIFPRTSEGTGWLFLPLNQAGLVFFLSWAAIAVALLAPSVAFSQAKVWFVPPSIAGDAQCLNPGQFGNDPNVLALQKQRQNNALTTSECGLSCRNPYTHLSTTINGDTATARLRSDCTGWEYEYAIIKIDNPKQPVCAASDTVANPCNLASGAKVQKATDYTDSAGDLSLTRVYNSKSADLFPGPFGRSWQSNFDKRTLGFVTPVSANDVRLMTVFFWRPEGRGLPFRFDTSTQQWKSDPDISERATQLVTAQGLHSGWILESSDHVNREIYDYLGKLIRLEDQRGPYLWLTYAANGLLSKVTDRAGRSLSISSNGANITQVTIPDGSKINYYYSSNILQEVVYPDATPGTQADNPKTKYLYEKAGQPQLLSGIVDESGGRSSSWDYDAQQRVILSAHGTLSSLVDRASIVYNTDGSATVTQALGLQTNMSFSEVQGVRRSTGLSGACPSCNGSQFGQRSFDANGFPDITVDLAGNRTNSDFDSSGRLVQQVEADTATDGSKRTTQTDWHSSLPVPTERRTYNATGMLVQKETWTYNSRGQVLTHTVSDL